MFTCHISLPNFFFLVKFSLHLCSCQSVVFCVVHCFTTGEGDWWWRGSKKESVFFHFHSEDNVWHIWTLFICSRPLHFGLSAGVSSISMSNLNVFFLRLKYNPQFTLVKITKQVMIVTSKGINTKNKLLDLKIHKLQAVLCFKKNPKKTWTLSPSSLFNLFFTRALSPHSCLLCPPHVF